MIEVSHLSFDYPTTRALDDVSFRVEPGSVTALVGPNGAGKTTLLRLLAALEVPYAGRVVVDGLDTGSQPRRVHQRLGYLPDFFGLYDQLSVRRSLVFAARARRVSAAQADAAATRAALRVGLGDRLEARAGELSRGLRQRLAIAQAIVHEPRVLLLDEPASGLDPVARRALSELILELQRQGMTILVSSHILSELDDYCTAMLAMAEGRLVAGGAIAATAVGHQRVRLRAAGEGLREALANRQIAAAAVADDGSVVVELPPGQEPRAALLASLVGAGIAVSDCSELPRTLEDAYLAQVGGERQR